MSKLKGKFKACILLLLLTLTIATLLVGVSVANAQETPWKQTYAFIGAIPNPVGVGQEVLIHFGISDALARVDLGWQGLTITVERPDGKTETLGPYKTDSTGGAGIVYIPNIPGTYYLQTHFPEQVNPAAALNVPAGTVMKASDSEKLALVVSPEPVPVYPSFDLPTEFWTRPIDSQIHEWTKIAGNWLQYVPNKFAPYNQGPETPHVLWAKPLIGADIGALGGGLAGGFIPETSGIDEHGFETGDAYQGLFGQPVIIAGVLYFNRYKSNGGTAVEQEVVAVDLRTGEELWVRNWNNTRLAFGQVFYWDSYNYHAVFAYLWSAVGSTWNAYDAATGRWVYSMTNVPSGTNIYGPKGEIYRYTVNLAAGWITLWNSSRVVSNEGSWAPYGNTYNCTWTAARQGGYEWNKTIPAGLPGSVNFIFFGDKIIGTSTQWMRLTPYPILMWGISVKPGEEGRLLFNKSWTPTQNNLTICIAAASVEDGVFVLVAKETRQFYGFSTNTGDLLWGPSEPKPYLDQYDITAASYDLFIHSQQVIAYGKLISGGTSGVVAAYDVRTGKLLWTYEAHDPYNEILWGVNWPLRIAFVTDGKVYLSHQERSPIDPKPRGAPFICLDIETGELVWRVDGLIRGTWWGGPPIIGDSIIASMDSYDQRVYAIGKGPSATTVTVQDDVVSLGESIVIKGTVMDISPGTKDTAIALRFPDGVPAVADECMGEWMLYVYKQFPRPSNVTGVWVKLDAINVYTGEYIDIGGTHTDSAGFYTVMWTPPKEGLYTILATFPGSKSYYPSYAETSIGVTAAPPPPPTPETPQIPTPPDYTPILTGLAVAIIVVAILVVYDIISVRKMRK